MIKKIISGGQPGVERAALDAAIKLNIPHKGWTYKTRRTDEGILPDKYRVKESEDISFSDRIEKNVLASDATAILTRGGLTIGLKIVKDCAEKHNRPYLHIDLNENPLNSASALIRKWMINNQLEAIYFTGSKSIDDIHLNQEVIRIIEGICRMESEQEQLPGFSEKDDHFNRNSTD
ncbi:MAG: putative molybdenum carrier protein [Desulfobacteraceae bacterium]|jgi:hypothetical protein|nr:putative molybdenum carrier protein [Desulfobacteraceae bacterium]